MIKDVSNEITLRIDNILEGTSSGNSFMCTRINQGNIAVYKKNINVANVWINSRECTSHEWKDIILKYPTINEYGYYKTQCQVCKKLYDKNCSFHLEDYDETPVYEIGYPQFNDDNRIEVDVENGRYFSYHIYVDHVNSNIINAENTLEEWPGEWEVTGLPEGVEFNESNQNISGVIDDESDLRGANHYGGDFIKSHTFTIKYRSALGSTQKTFKINVYTVSVVVYKTNWEYDRNGQIGKIGSTGYDCWCYIYVPQAIFEDGDHYVYQQLLNANMKAYVLNTKGSRTGKVSYTGSIYLSYQGVTWYNNIECAYWKAQERTYAADTTSYGHVDNNYSRDWTPQFRLYNNNDGFDYRINLNSINCAESNSTKYTYIELEIW